MDGCGFAISTYCAISGTVLYSTVLLGQKRLVPTRKGKKQPIALAMFYYYCSVPFWSLLDPKPM
jgi:hypothetical protein